MPQFMDVRHKSHVFFVALFQVVLAMVLQYKET